MHRKKTSNLNPLKTLSIPYKEIVTKERDSYGGGYWWQCAICGSGASDEDDLKHKKDCLLVLYLEKSKKENQEKIQQEIRKILRQEWNPIGFDDCLPDDEYDSYVIKIYALLEEGAEISYIANTLTHFCTKWMELKGDMSKDYKIAASIWKIYNHLKNNTPEEKN